jgi:hypothetical protein
LLHPEEPWRNFMLQSILRLFSILIVEIE